MFRQIIALALGTLIAAASPAAAQSFGRNKVHYDDFDFHILDTEHFDIYYYSAEREASVDAGRLAERWYARFSQILNHTFKQRQSIILYGSHAQFAETNVLPGFLGDGTGGVTEQQKGRIVLPFAAGLGETDHVLGHELVHAFQRDILRENGRSISTLPLWFLEGMAEFLSVGGVDPNTAMWMRDAVLQNQLPEIDQLDNPRWFPYRYGQALWAYLADRFGEQITLRCLTSKAAGGAVGRLVAATGIDVRTLSKDWHESLRRAARAEAPAAAQPKAVIASTTFGRLNVSPALSPDGRSVVFLSERDQYSVDVFLADAATGAIERKIVQTAGDPHFDSLQFIDSAGAWDPSGQRFALAALSRGQAVITIVNVRNGGVEREFPIRDVDQAFSPTWSPDGRRIAFSGLKGGLSDLYVVDLADGSVRALTRDAFADLQPSWSPDGRTIAFSSDRFSSSVESLTFGDFQLAAIDVASGAVHSLPSVTGAKNIDPHWSADGRSLYFVADADRVSNVFRLDIAAASLFQVTNIPTGVSGVTALSPALSVAAQTDRLAFSVYRHGAYEILAIDGAEGTPVAPAIDAGVPPAAADLPPPASALLTTERPLSSSAAVTVPALGAQDGKAFTFRPYHPGLSLDRLVQPYLSVGGGSTGGFIRAGVALGFGDMLGDRQLQTAIQVGKSVDDFIAQAAYLNMGSRWNWGVVGGQVPWLIGAAPAPATAPAGQSTITREEDVFRQLHRQLSGVAVYPFSGAKRLEFTGGLHSISYDREATTSVYSGVTGQLVNASTLTSAALPDARLFETGAALVYDTSVFGPTSPILGQRYRFGIAPTFGTLTYTTVTADYRRYLMPVRPFTLALRVMHVGRYGSDANDPRILPLVWTLRDVIRGYGDAGPGSGSILSASRMLVGNAELRFPIPGVFHQQAQPGPLPIEGLVFSDAGQFWSPGDGSTSAGLRSAGAGVRFNVMGFVFELDAVRRFDPDAHGWGFAFNFRPGF